jgi:hypothetical protein
MVSSLVPFPYDGTLLVSALLVSAKDWMAETKRLERMLEV